MMKSLFHICVLLRLSSGWWLFEQTEEEKEKAVNEEYDVKHKMIHFEATTAEQKFLQEANQLLNLSPLDSCQHKVVEMLRHSCGQLSEEEIAKLSVQLLNCQSEAEGRDTYICTQDMDIAECTRPMDPHTWNAYHIISNRARSVCYGIRQSLFRTQTELAVNRLSQSTFNQLKSMEQLSLNQDEIRQSTLDSLNALKEEKVELIKRQSDFNTYHDMLKKAMEDNIKQLHEERTLIDNGQSLIHNMTDSILVQLKSAHNSLLEHEKDHLKHQQKVSKELNRLQHNVKEVWSSIDNSTERLLEVINRLNNQYEDMQEKLNSVNKTISHVLQLLDSMNDMINIQLGWLLDTVGGAKDGLYILTSIATHGVFLLVSCLVLLFLKAPWLSRLMLLVIVVINMIVDVNITSGGLSVIQLIVLIIMILIGDFMFLSYKYHQSRTSTLAMPIFPPPQPINSSNNTTGSTIDISDGEIDDLYTDIHENGGYIPNNHLTTPVKVAPPMLNTTSTPGVEDFPSTPTNCRGYTRSGLQCRLAVTPGTQYCFRHKQ